MDDINKPKVSKDKCGCLIDDLLIDKDKNSELCSTRSSDIEVFTDPDPEKISYDFYIRRMTDGLPVIPPTKERVQKLLNYTDRDFQELIAVLPPRMGRATPEKIAVNSVMAGCMPQFMPMLMNIIESISDYKFNLAGINATTHPVSICTIMNGQISREIGASGGAGCLGPGNIANASIGRAVRLCLMNIAGAVPGLGDHATLGSPAKYSYAFAEFESESPWESLSNERGFNEDTSTTTVMAVEAPQNVNDHRSKRAEDLLETIVQTASTAGCNNSHVPGEILLIMSPEHAKTISNDGWNKQDIKNYLHENCSVLLELADRGGRKIDEKWIDDENIRITRTPEDVVVVVAGGVGRHSMICHGFGTSSESITKPLTLKDGTSIGSIDDYKK
jgi:hypothetical protein